MQRIWFLYIIICSKFNFLFYNIKKGIQILIFNCICLIIKDNCYLLSLKFYEDAWFYKNITIPQIIYWKNTVSYFKIYIG